MQFETIRDFAEWPGIPSFDSASYNCSTGITPGVITAVSRIPPTTAAPLGTFRFYDGNRIVELHDCKLHAVEAVSGSEGPIYTYRILDHRWRWQFGEITRKYNVRDRRDNIVPWFVKSPEQIAIECLKLMGEKDYEIDLPPGLTKQDLDQFRDNPAPGQKTPVTKTNPEIYWDGERPAVALDRLCGVFGRRVVWDYTNGKVKIVKPGYGADLQAMPHLDEIRAHIDQPVKPKGIGIIGAPVRVQMRLKLIPVGEEWDGRFLPIDELSYAPDFTPTPGEWSITFGTGPSYTGTVSVNGEEYTIDGQTTGSAAAAAMADLLNEIDVDGDEATATASGATVTFSVPADGKMPDILASSGAKVTMTKMPIKSAWQTVKPDAMYNVKATDRLTYEHARQLAQKTVFRYYRLADDDLSTGWDDDRDKTKKINVPRYGEIDRRQNLILMNTMVEQVNPQARDENRLTVSSTGIYLSENPDYYDGYSRDQQARVYGSVARLCNGDFLLSARGLNTPEDMRIASQFSIDTANQVVMFNRPMYRSTISGPHWRVDAPFLTLETSVMVLDNKTLAPIRYRRWIKFDDMTPNTDKDGDGKPDDPAESIVVRVADYELKGGLPPAFELKNPHDNSEDLKEGQPETDEQIKELAGIQWFKHEDVPFVVIGKYSYDEETKAYTLDSDENEADDVSKPRADYYLGGHVLEYLPKAGQTAVYHGVHQIGLDGAIQQVSINVGSGAKTSASRNAEHIPWLPSLPARRRAEGLAADEEARRQNLAEQGGIVAPEEAARRTAAMARAQNQ